MALFSEFNRPLNDILGGMANNVGTLNPVLASLLASRGDIVLPGGYTDANGQQYTLQNGFATGNDGMSQGGGGMGVGPLTDQSLYKANYKLGEDYRHYFDPSGKYTGSYLMKDIPGLLQDMLIPALAAGGMYFGLGGLGAAAGDAGAAGALSLDALPNVGLNAFDGGLTAGVGSGSISMGGIGLPAAAGAGAGAAAGASMSGGGSGAAGGSAAGAGAGGGGLFSGLGDAASKVLSTVLGGGAGGSGMAGSIVGGLFSGLGSIASGKAAEKAASTSAAAMRDAAQIAADASKFRPVGITNRFGSSNFSFDSNGNLTGAGYNLSPDIAAYRDAVLGMGGDAFSAGQGLFNLGRSYLATSPQAAAQKYMADQQAVLAPSREREFAKLNNTLFNTGTGGLAVGATSDGQLARNPLAAAYFNAIMDQDRKLAAEADEYGMNRVKFGSGLLSGAFSPLQTILGVGSGIDKLGMDNLTVGSELGGRAAGAGARAGDYLFRGGVGAAQTIQAGTPNLLGSLLTSASQSPALRSLFTSPNPAGTPITPVMNEDWRTIGNGMPYEYQDWTL